MKTIRDALAQAKAFGFLGPGSVDAHIAGAAAFVAALQPFAGRGLDVGTGAGVPGLVLAEAFPPSTWVLVDSSRRRTSVLTAAVAELGLAGRVSVVRARVEELAHDPTHRFQYDVVTARSFGPPAETAELSVAFLKDGGRLIVAEPPASAGERWLGVERIGLRPVGRWEGGGAHVAVFARSGAVAPEIPRAIGRTRAQPVF